MPAFPNFVGPSYTSRSVTVAADRTVNLYPEVVESQSGKNVAALYGVPGIQKFCTLPTSPTRGIWIGEGRMFAAAGSRYYEVFPNGTYTDRGDIGAGTGPVQMFSNGSQVMIVAGGLVYIDTGTALVQPIYTPAQGYVNVVDDGLGYGYTHVQLTYGDQFDTSMVGGAILIGSPPLQYEVASFIDPWNITLTTPAGPQVSAPYSIPQSGTVATNGTAVSYNSGDLFYAAMAGHPILINEITYTVASVDPPYHLTLTSSAGVHLDDRVPYAASVPVTASCGACLDGYFIVAAPESGEIHVSAIRNGLHWDPLDSKIKEAFPDNIAMLLADHQELWVSGTTLATEVWRDTGAADFPFERDLGAIMQIGCLAPWSVVRIAQGVAFLGGDPQGKPVCYRAQGFQPVRISTHAVEVAWESYSTVADAEAWVYLLDGHEVMVINFPTGNATWCWDAKTQLWFERQYGTSGRWRGRNHGYVWGRHYVGDYATGDLYKMSNDLYTDDGTEIVHIRRCPHLSEEQKRLFFSVFRVDMEKATGFDATLSWSNNGGKDFTTPIRPDGELVSNGTPGNTIGQEWRRLGSGRDRVFELKIWASSRVAITNAYLNTT